MKRINKISNENGAFFCEGDCLVGFSSYNSDVVSFLRGMTGEDRLSYSGYRESFGAFAVPEGIRKVGRYFLSFNEPDPYSLQSGLFVDSEVKGELMLPDSLRYIGMHFFMGAVIGRLTLPRELRGISCGAFLRSTVGELIVPRGFGENIRGGYDEPDEAGVVEVGGRQFKESYIEKLYLPEEFKGNVKRALFPEANIGEIIRY
ncbi:MAG: hypothetical protein IKM46_07150 [Clostridia bacterium]|nr:hypothetical protein [Clostridia bacterium]